MKERRKSLIYSRKFIGGVILLCALGAFVFTVYSKDSSSKIPENGRRLVRSPKMMDVKEFRSQSLVGDSVLPKPVVEAAVRTTSESKFLKIEGVKTHIVETKPPSDVETRPLEILLLHGMAFKIKTWQDLGTLKLLAGMGYRSIAVDLPGFGESEGERNKFSSEERRQYLEALIEKLKIKHVVIVSPSFSGGYAIPYLISHSHEMSGYIPVAPVGTNKLLEVKSCSGDAAIAKEDVSELLVGSLPSGPLPNLGCLKVPTLVLFGERDNRQSSAILNLLPYSVPLMIPNAGHACYKDDPVFFHKGLYDFLRLIEGMRK